MNTLQDIFRNSSLIKKPFHDDSNDEMIFEGGDNQDKKSLRSNLDRKSTFRSNQDKKSTFRSH